MDKYENSLLYTGENTRKQTISFAVTKGNLPEYFDLVNPKFDMIHEQLETWETQGLISLCWKNKKRGLILEKCILNTDRADEVYSKLGRKPKRDKEKDILDICKMYTGQHRILDDFLQYVKERLERHESIARYADLDDPEQFQLRCRLISAMLSNKEEIFLREFSSKILGDSKTAEKEIAAAAGVIAGFSSEGRFENLDTEQVLEECQIYRNPSYIYVKGMGAFRNNRTEACLADWSAGLGIPSGNVGDIVWQKNIIPEKLVTIENLTTFHRWNEPGTLTIYLGGYHNSAKRQFLINLHSAFPGCPCFHFGDIDCGGFLIWKDLCLKTGISFLPLYMDADTYLANIHTGKTLTGHDRNELSKMQEDSFFAGQRDLFSLMLERGIKLEQEGIKFTK